MHVVVQCVAPSAALRRNDHRLCSARLKANAQLGCPATMGNCTLVNTLLAGTLEANTNSQPAG